MSVALTSPFAQVLGFDPQVPSNTFGNFAMSGANSWVAWSFIAPASVNLTDARVNVAIVNGTLAAGDITCSLYDDNAGVPGSSIATSSTTSPSPISAAGWTSWTFSQALTIGKMYWLVFKNVNATPATNNVTLQTSTSTGDNVLAGGNQPYGWSAATTTNGTSWTKKNQGAGLRVGFSNGSYAGLPVTGNLNPAQNVYSNKENGILFTTPGNAAVNVIGAGMFIHQLGSPTGDPLFKLYNGTTLMASTNTVLNASVVSNGWYPSFFSSTQVLLPNTTYRLTLADGGSGAASDTNSNAWQNPQYTIDSDSNSLILLPWSMQQTSFDGTSWSQTSNTFTPWAVILAPGSEFASLRSGVRGILTGGRM